MEAGWRLDLTAARLGLGIRAGGQISEDTRDALSLNAKHPLLSLSESNVVANDLGLDSKALGLVPAQMQEAKPLSRASSKRLFLQEQDLFPAALPLE